MPSKNENAEINDEKTVYNVGNVVEHILECDNADVQKFMKNQAERLRKLRTLREESTANKVINGESGGDNGRKVSDIDVERIIAVVEKIIAAAAKIIADEINIISDEMVKQLGSDFSMQVARGIMDSAYGMDHNYFTWDELFDKAVSTGFLSDELKAKDNARSAMRDVILDETGVDIDKSESAEDEIDKFLNESNTTYYFDESGNIAREVIK